jgi:hypothetical protein
MGFRRNGEDQRASQKWVDQHRETLVTCSMPDFVPVDRLTWLRFLENGGWHHEPRWGVWMLSPHQAGALYDFVESQYGIDLYRSLLRNLDDARRKPST